MSLHQLFFNGPTPLEVRKSKSKILNSKIYLQFLKNDNLIFTQEKNLFWGQTNHLRFNQIQQTFFYIEFFHLYGMSTIHSRQF